jgi:hypothetical protein
MYDYYLGGAHNFETDRAMADKILGVYPDLALAARANRAFLRRAATFLCAQGIDQFLDLGSGIPTVGNVHEVVQSINPAVRVVYVDSDPVAVQHSMEMLRDNPLAGVIQADVRDIKVILAHTTTQGLLDLQRPLGVLLVGILPFVTDDGEVEVITQDILAAVAPGSYLAVSHGTMDEAPQEQFAQMLALYQQTDKPGKARSRADIVRLLHAIDLVEPGLVFAPRWRPESAHEIFFEQPERAFMLACVGRVS